MVLSTALVACISAVATAQPAPGRGDAAPPISIDALTNASLGDQANWRAWAEGTTVIEFWGAWCAPCVAAIPHLNELHDYFAPKGVNFLSVTFEEPAITDTFQERKKLHTWIGHDMDRSMVEDYGVRSWPTTFVVRDGVIVARTHPNQLSKDRLAALVEGRPDPLQPKPAAETEAEKDLGADGRPVISGGVRPGIDPFTPIEDQPAVQVIVRPAGDYSTTTSSGMAMTALGADVANIVRMTHTLSGYAMEVDPAVPDQKYDVIYRIPREQYPALMSSVRELILVGLGVRLETENREVDAYELRVAETGLKLQDSGMGRQMGISSQTTESATTIISSSGKMATLAAFISSNVGAPVLNRTDHEGFLFLDLELPRDKGELSKMLRQEAGLVLVPTKHEIEFTTIVPAQ
ncbi:MAG: TIGR03435 family protein [Phycisphaerales bacterium]